MTQRTADELSRLLEKIDRRGYKAYKEIAGSYEYSRYTLYIDHVQGDPFAAPSKVRVRVPMAVAGFPEDTRRPLSREIGLRDWLTREFGRACRMQSRRQSGAGPERGSDNRGGPGRAGIDRAGPDRAEHTRGGLDRGRAGGLTSMGSGKSGLIEIDTPGQEVIGRTSCIVTEQYVEARLVVGLPAFGRRIAGRQADEIFSRRIPSIVVQSLLFDSLDREELYRAVETAEDADHLREALVGQDLIAFVADGAILPRRSGIDDRLMPGKDAIPFRSPDSLRVDFSLPNRGKVTGMGIPKGVTLIVGGGYHGKSTLLNAIERGVYNHIPGDGRELAVSDPDAVKIRAEDGRRIEKTTITPFISHLPYGRDTDAFSTDNASGSTSQAANIVEAVEAGASCLLIDEDTSATNFMIRDHRMQELISKDREPITPFIDKVRQLFLERDVSTILVIGGSGDYFDVSDLVIGMSAYVPQNLTREARRIADKYRSERAPEGGDSFGRVFDRAPLQSGIDPSRGKRDVKINIRGSRMIDFGSERIDLGAVEQLIHPGQARAIALAMVHARRMMDDSLSLRELLDRIMVQIREGGLDILCGPAGGKKPGDLVQFRRLELAAAFNRLRSFKVRQIRG